MSWASALKILPQVLEDITKQQAFRVQAHIGNHMRNVGKGSAVYPNATDQLQVVSGRLYKSFLPGKPDNVFRRKGSSGKFGVEYGSKVIYAAIHEYGGTINHPGSTKRQAWYSDGQLVVTHKTKPHQITIDARPYLAPALEDYKSSNDNEELFNEALRKLKRELFKV